MPGDPHLLVSWWLVLRKKSPRSAFLFMSLPCHHFLIRYLVRVVDRLILTPSPSCEAKDEYGETQDIHKSIASPSITILNVEQSVQQGVSFVDGQEKVWVEELVSFLWAN